MIIISVVSLAHYAARCIRYCAYSADVSSDYWQGTVIVVAGFTVCNASNIFWRATATRGLPVLPVIMQITSLLLSCVFRRADLPSLRAAAQPPGCGLSVRHTALLMLLQFVCCCPPRRSTFTRRWCAAASWPATRRPTSGRPSSTLATRAGWHCWCGTWLADSGLLDLYVVLPSLLGLIASMMPTPL